MTHKRLLRPERQRQIPPHFSWVDHRLIRQHRLRDCEHGAWALYVKKNFLAGLEIPSLAAVNHGVRHWLEHVANVRRHAETHQTPMELFGQEVPQLRPANLQPYQTAVVHHTRANSRCRVAFDSNRYSVPPRFAERPVRVKAYPDRLVIYHQDQPIAEHRRSYERHQDVEQPEHTEELLAQRRAGRQQQLLLRFMALSPQAEAFRTLKSEVKVRPIWHWVERRVEAHVLVAFLGYCLWVCLKKKAQRAAPSLTPWQILDQLGRIALVEVWLELRDGRQMCLPRITHPEPAQAVLLAQLKWSLPPQPPPRVHARDVPPAAPNLDTLVESE